MSTLLPPPVLCLLLIGQVVNSDASVRYVVSRRQSFDDSYVFSGRVLFARSASTLTACSVLCVTDDVCTMFSFAVSTSEDATACRGYVDTAAGTPLVVMAARLYSVTRRMASSSATADAEMQTTDGALVMTTSVSVEEAPPSDGSKVTEVTAMSTSRLSSVATSSVRSSASTRSTRKEADHFD